MEQTFYISKMINDAHVSGQYSSLGFAHTICAPIIKYLDESKDNIAILDYSNTLPDSPFVVDSVVNIINFDDDKLKRIKILNLDLDKWQTAVIDIINNQSLYSLALSKLDNPKIQQLFEDN